MGNHDRGVARAAASVGPQRADGAAPQLLAGGLLHRGDHGALTARGEDQFLPVHQWRLRVFPAGHHPAAVLLHQRLPPALFPCRGLQANQIAFGADCVEQVSIHGRCAARAVVLIVPRGSHLRGPQLLAVRKIQGGDKLPLAAVAHGENLPADNGQTGKPLPDAWSLPRQRGATFRPRLEQARFRGNGVAVRPAPSRPVAAKRGDARLAGRQQEHARQRCNHAFESQTNGMTFVHRSRLSCLV